MKVPRLPLKPGTKAPAVSGWAAADYETPADLDHEHAGLRTDVIVVVDCDNREAVESWLSHEPTAANTYRVKTARGEHFYYQRPEPAPDWLRPGPMAPGIDIKTGTGAYVVAAGSLHPDGSVYEAVDENASIAPLPPLVQSTLARTQQGTASESPAGSGETWEQIPDGRRDITLTAIAGTLRKQGMSTLEIARTLAGINARYCEPPLESVDIKRISLSVSRYEVDPDQTDIAVLGQGIDLIDGSELGKPPPKTWLWDPYVPDRTLTLVSGREGIGKGLFCAYMAAHVTRGCHPETGESMTPKSVLWFSAEDHHHLDIWPRLRAAGWEPGEHEKVWFQNPTKSLVLPEDIDHLTESVEAGNHGLVIMDPGRSFIGDRHRVGTPVSYNNESDIRPALQRLLHMSAELQVPIIFVGHWKKGDAQVADMTSGTLAWKQVVRHALDFAKVEEERAFWVGKANNGPSGFVRSYRVEPVEEWESARFVLGDPLPFASLDAWMKSSRESSTTVPTEVFIGIAKDWGAANLTKGDRWPSVKELPAVIDGIPSGRTAEEINKILQSNGTIQRVGRTVVWMG
jgi:hypothetical protein